MNTTKKIPFEWVLEKTKTICSKQEKCISEIRDKLQKMNISDTDKDKVINTLIEENFINEQRYASSFVADKFRFNKWGKRKIAHTLRQKGIPGDIAQQALNKIDEPEYQKMIMEELKKKKNTIRPSCKNTVKEKIFRFAQNRGYEHDYIYRFINML